MAAGAGAIELASVGIYAITGSLCPASGWWLSQESDALDGMRWFAAGSQLPVATFAVPADVFAKATGTPKAIQRRGAWQLVRLAQAPDADDSAGKIADQEPGGNGVDARGKRRKITVPGLVVVMPRNDGGHVVFTALA